METDQAFPEAILYELICCGEWRDEREEQHSQLLPNNQNPAGNLLSYFNPSKLIRKRQFSIAESVKWLKSVGPSWQVSLSPNGNVVALLQTISLETRSYKEGFSSIMGRTVVLKDPNPSCRHIAWSLDSSMVAISFSNGQLIFYDTMAVQLFSVLRCVLPSQEELSANIFSVENDLAGLFFASERVKKNSYTNELISLDTKGFIKCFRQTSADQMTFHHDASIRRYYPRGVYSSTYIEKFAILLIAGVLEMESRLDACHSFGISAWRLINDVPYYKILFNVPSDEFRMDSRRSWKTTMSSLFSDTMKSEDAIFKMIPSPSMAHVATIHSSGTISIWHLPSLKLFRSWPLKNQFHHWTENSRFNNRWRLTFNRWNEEKIDNWRFHPLDLNWWNDNIVIIARVNGCVSLCSIDEELPTKNLLGDSPEIFESPVFLTPKKMKGFLALECEFKLKMDDKRNSNGDIIEMSETACLELLDAYDAQFLPKTLIQEVLFWITDIEQFRPPRKRKRKSPTWKETHRIFLLRNITPQELFHQKIEAEEYGEALDLARAYKLDSDLVYQRQWSKSPVSVNTIRDYLGKIKKRNWVLQECLERIPPNADAARELLTFGLQGTDLRAAVLISQGRDKGLFQLLTPDDLDISTDQYLMLVDGDNLEVKRLLSYRKQFLYYIDMLDTYELMVGGPRMVEENFDGPSYAKLRSRRPAESAVDMARTSDVAALRILLVHHWFEIAQQYLSVISSFPETTSPIDYSEFLPEISVDGHVLLWDDYVLKERDWCERFLEGGEKLRRSSAGSIEMESSVDRIASWYEGRIHEIEKLSGITSYSLDLAKLGVQRNIPGLERLVKDLEVVEIMVYDAKVDITLEKLEELSPIDRLHILMSNTTEENFIAHIRDYVMPFLHKCELQEQGSRFHILDQYLTSISTHNLTKSLQIFENSRPGCSDPIVTDTSELMLLAKNCIYACENAKQIENVLAILTCLPERHRGVVNDGLQALHDSIQDMELHYQGVKILDKYNIGISIQKLKEVALVADESDAEIELFFKNICDTSLHMKPPMKINEWKSLLYDVLDLQKKVFKAFSLERCFELYVEALLRSGSAEIISLARDFIDHQTPDITENDEDISNTTSNNFKTLIRRVSSAYSTAFALYLYLIPYPKSLNMVMAAAYHYFDSASNYADPDIELCKVCLNLMQNPKDPEVSQIYDLIDAVKIVNKDFRLNILPQNVRLARDKMKLIQQTMEHTVDGYKKVQQLLTLAMFLNLGEQNISVTESKIYELCGNAALSYRDMKYCVQICENIIAKGYEMGWQIFAATAKYESDPPILDVGTRLAFINYALNMCPDDEILNVLNSKYLIEIRSLQKNISDLSSPESSELDAPLVAASDTPDMLNPVKLNEFLSTSTRLISSLKDVAHVVTTGTGTLLNPSKLAGLTSRFLTDSKLEMGGSSSAKLINESSLTNSFILESYPFFYFNENELKSRYLHPSLLAFKYDSFSGATHEDYVSSNPTLQLCFSLNRIWHCERSLLGIEECGERDGSVLEQLVLMILPEDLLWGLAILFSIEDLDVIQSVLSKIPVTPVSNSVIIYYLSLLIAKRMDRLESTLQKDPNKIPSETKLFLQSVGNCMDDEYLMKLSDLFNHYRGRSKNVA
ncbi:neuroblastoma-amplified sequence [Folsomia candida]|uniref:neuroblastoma-amplified sequence n=1 Tax=Folsomia candida TaxID=158441 RepID=UPI000B8F9B37|nr:neuroblastoma-amplified sequence [Folsomia candida]